MKLRFAGLTALSGVVLAVSSSDGGVTWEDVGLPPFPGNEAGSVMGLGTLILPDGSLLFLSHPSYLLQPAASAWCTVSGLPDVVSRNTGMIAASIMAGNQLLLAIPAQGALYSTPEQVVLVPLAAIHC